MSAIVGQCRTNGSRGIVKSAGLGNDIILLGGYINSGYLKRHTPIYHIKPVKLDVQDLMILVERI